MGQRKRSYRPADGMIVTANQRIVPDDYPHFISAEWTLPLRHDRIRFLLTRKDRHDSASFAAVQADTPTPSASPSMLTQQHALIRSADEYGDLFAHAATATSCAASDGASPGTVPSPGLSPSTASSACRQNAYSAHTW